MADPDHHQCDEEEFFSVWAIPPDDLRNKLKTLMTTLRSEFGGAEFEPHVTVVRALRLRAADALRRLHSAVSSLNYYSARVSSISRGSCVSLLLDPTPEVVNASCHCRAHFGYSNSTPYMPHLSLLYGDLTEEAKEKARARAEELAEGIVGTTFDISKIALFKTDPQDTSLWEKVAVCELLKDK
ncbi:cyclic phosphodiesterase-like [Dioscorea cayenensis subsp. rotundata]|uniref:Cyclic phosphodiesterase-like n=1 Tax=Dioscorea cayennensis subsp. rotundata TaxID=55577 RepID=A0AB40B3D6_DIOCR|nr:cyclic phosphodiesterase-like [Dioscorea cayenensis subsp. rotundata]